MQIRDEPWIIGHSVRFEIPINYNLTFEERLCGTRIVRMHASLNNTVPIGGSGSKRVSAILIPTSLYNGVLLENLLAVDISPAMIEEMVELVRHYWQEFSNLGRMAALGTLIKVGRVTEVPFIEQGGANCVNLGLCTVDEALASCKYLIFSKRV